MCGRFARYSLSRELERYFYALPQSFEIPTSYTYKGEPMADIIGFPSEELTPEERMQVEEFASRQPIFRIHLAVQSKKSKSKSRFAWIFPEVCRSGRGSEDKNQSGF